MKTRKSDGMDFADWYEEYLTAVEENGGYPVAADEDMARRLYDKDWTYSKAGADDADFMNNG